MRQFQRPCLSRKSVTPYFAAILALIFACSGCRTSSPDVGSEALAEVEAAAAPGSGFDGEVSAAFRSGTTDGLDWEVRFNLPVCDHSDEGQRAGAWCTVNDLRASAEKSGVQNRLASWVWDPQVKEVHMAYFSFSNKFVRRQLCAAAEAKDLKVILYIHQQNFQHANVRALDECHANTKVVARGTTFGTANGYLQHAKIFLAVEYLGAAPSADLSGEAAANASATKVRWTSSSANMSSFGTSLHFENWMFMTGDHDSHLAQSNLCAFKGFKEMSGSDRESFAEIYKNCRDDIAAQPREDIKFFMVPHGNINPRPFNDMRSMLNGAEQDIKVAIHRLTTSGIWRPLKQKAQAGLNVQVIFDDDTLRSGVTNGGAALDVGPYDVRSYREVRDGGAKVTFVETNADSTTHLHHNKFLIVDEKSLFVGAGNFTSSSLNSFGLGNFEQFYVITEPSIVQAYVDGWAELKSRSTAPADHPVGNNTEKNLVCDPQCEFSF